METELIRMIERILIVFGRILSIFLGYRLFLVVGQQAEGNANLQSQILTASISKVGPGVFFAFFGAYILYSATIPIKRDVDTIVVYHPIQATTSNTASSAVDTAAPKENVAKDMLGLGDDSSTLAATNKLEQIKVIASSMPEGKDKSALLEILNKEQKVTNGSGGGTENMGITYKKNSGFSGSSVPPIASESRTNMGNYGPSTPPVER